MKSLLKKIPTDFFEKRLFSPFSFLIASFIITIPLIISIIHFSIEYKQLKNLNKRIISLQKKSIDKEAQVKSEEQLLHQIKNSHSKYLETALESMVFLGSERQKWQLFSEQIEPSHPMKERVSFLEHGNNKLQFIQSEIRKSKLFQETEEKQKNPIEISEEDLKTLLCYIEGSKIHPHLPKKGAPQILLKSFELEKKTILGIADKTYHVQMQLIKREALLKP
jgi:hypothetical protein